MNPSLPGASGAGLGEPVAEAGPFPLGSVQSVASLAWRLCLVKDPFGLLIIPYILFFPVFVFLTILAELMRELAHSAPDTTLLGAIFGILPLVIFARIYGEAWILTRADALARGERPGLGETLGRAFARTWYLALVMLVVYALFQLGLVLFVIPGLLIWVVTSFANQAAVLGPGRLFASLRRSRDLLEHNVTAWLGTVAYWGVAFLGLGILVGIFRQSIESLSGGGDSGFLLDLLFGTPVQLCLIVFTVGWTLLYREAEARWRRRLAAVADPPAGEPTMPAPGAAS